MDDSSGDPYVFITLLGTGMPWSEEKEGLGFLEWASSCLEAEADEFSWMEDPGEQQMEFTGASQGRGLQGRVVHGLVVQQVLQVQPGRDRDP